MWFIGPHETQAFKFKVKIAGKIGVGLGVESDLLSARLYDKEFNLLGDGALIFLELSQGEYFLVVTAGEKPVQYRPIIYGLDGSLQDVPQEIIEQYKEQGRY